MGSLRRSCFDLRPVFFYFQNMGNKWKKKRTEVCVFAPMAGKNYKSEKTILATGTDQSYIGKSLYEKSNDNFKTGF